MNHTVDLLKGNITNALMKLALPIMGSAFIQMAYSLIDTAWVGILGSSAVTAVGTAGIFLWIGQGLSMIPQIGGQILVGQAIGEGSLPKAGNSARSAIQLIVMIMVVYTAFVIALNGPLIGFFDLHSASTIASARSYLVIVGLGMLSMGFNFVMTGIFTGIGNSATTFKYNAIGMVMNIVLDPAMIFGILIFPEWGVNGAGIATVISQVCVSALYIRKIIISGHIFEGMNVVRGIDVKHILRIFKLGLPPAIQNIGFALITMVISRMITVYGDAAIAIQRIGSQIESVTWMTGDGFNVATNTFMAQNYGARRNDRIKKGYSAAFRIVTILGIATSAVLFFWARPIFSIFIHDQVNIAAGANYLHIVAISQLFMFYEIMSSGAFAGLGRTKLPSIIGLVLTASRIPLAIMLSSYMGSIDGVWWAISITSIAKGIIIAGLFIRYIRKPCFACDDVIQ